MSSFACQFCMQSVCEVSRLSRRDLSRARFRVLDELKMVVVGFTLGFRNLTSFSS